MALRRGRTPDPEAPSNAVKGVVFSPDGRLVATASASGQTEIWNAASGRNVREVLDSKRATNALAFSPNSSLLATGADDGAVRV